MTKILALLLIVSCNLTVTTDKVPRGSVDVSGEDLEGIVGEAPEKQPEIKPEEPEEDPKSKIDLNNIDLPALVSNPVNVIFARGLYEEFVKRIKVSAEERELDVSAVEWDKVFDGVIAACKEVESKKFTEIIDELDPKMMNVFKEDPGLSTPENIAFIESHKDDFLKLVKVLGPTLIENGLGSLAVAEFYSKIP